VLAYLLRSVALSILLLPYFDHGYGESSGQVDNADDEANDKNAEGRIFDGQDAG
jgi:hypothetical protein